MLLFRPMPSVDKGKLGVNATVSWHLAQIALILVRINIVIIVQIYCCYDARL